MPMPMRKSILPVLLLAFVLMACDNEEDDLNKIHLSAQIAYQGQSVQVRNGEILYALCEEGREKSPMGYQVTTVNWNGNFHSEINKGKNYRLVRRIVSVPWVYLQRNDTTFLKEYKGEKLNINVIPYYTLNEVAIKRQGNEIIALCKVEDVIGTQHNKKIEKLCLYVSSGIIVDNMSANLGSKELTKVASGKLIQLHTYIKNEKGESPPADSKVYARLGLKLKGVTAMIYSSPFEL